MKLQFIEFEGNKYRLSGRYYRRNRWDQPGPSNLHRAIWESANGAIPDGHDVHHIDGDSFNNTLANLALIESRAHVRQHTLKRIAAGELLPPGEKARAEAAKWHGSEEGLAWHRVNGKQAWSNREWFAKTCVVCGAGFKTPFANRAKYCHPNCKQQALRERRGRPVGTRPERKKQRAPINPL